jgi:hypothetical protein
MKQRCPLRPIQCAKARSDVDLEISNNVLNPATRRARAVVPSGDCRRISARAFVRTRPHSKCEVERHVWREWLGQIEMNPEAPRVEREEQMRTKHAADTALSDLSRRQPARSRVAPSGLQEALEAARPRKLSRRRNGRLRRLAGSGKASHHSSRSRHRKQAPSMAFERAGISEVSSAIVISNRDRTPPAHGER